MRNIFSYLIIGVAAYKLTNSFTNSDEVVTFFNIELNPWAYRLLWFSAACLSGFNLYKSWQEKQNRE